MAYRPLSIGGQVADLGVPEDILAQSINAGAARDARRRAALDAQKAQLDLAKQTIENQELDRGVKEAAAKRNIDRQYIFNREGAQDLPIGIQSPEFMEPERPSNAPFGPMNAPAPKPNRMERNTILDLAAVNPDFAENFRKGQIGERQGVEDRARKIAGEDQTQLDTAAEFGRKKSKDANDLALDTRQQSEVERNNRAQNNVAWFIANTGRQKANAKGIPDPIKLAKTKASKEGAINELDATADVIDRLIGSTDKGIKPHPGISGLTGKTSIIPFDLNSNTRDAEALRQQLVAKAAFAELQKMRANSPTGGALGAVSDKEGQLLQNAAAALQRGQSPEQFRKNLEGYRRQLRVSKQRIQEAYQKDFGQDIGGGATSTLTPEEEAELQALQQAAGQQAGGQ